MRINYRRPVLYEKQRRALFCPERYSFIEASTKSGKTHGALAWLIEQAIVHGGPGRNFWWVAPVQKTSNIAYKRAKRALKSAKPKFNDTEKYITFINGSVMEFRSGENPDTLYGDDVDAAVVDEGSRCKDDAWYAIRSTLTYTEGKLRVIGNVKGRKNWFYTRSRLAQQGEPDHAYHQITCWDAIEAGVLKQVEVEDARRVLPEAVFKELYEAEASDDGGNPFGHASIQKCIAALSSDPTAVYGLDLAKSKDYSVLLGLDQDGHTSAFDRFQMNWRPTIQRTIDTIGNVRTLVDSTGVGDAIVEELQEEIGNTVEGFKYTGPSKQQLMEGLAVAIQRREVTFPEGPIADELMSFEYEYTRNHVVYTAPEGMYDDCVQALALAVKHRNAQLFMWGPA